jgi:hypothetical protein
MDTNPTSKPPWRDLLRGRKIVMTTGRRNIVCHERNHIPDLIGPIERMRGEERNVAAMPMMTAIARRPAMRGVEKVEYWERNAIMEPNVNRVLGR